MIAVEGDSTIFNELASTVSELNLRIVPVNRWVSVPDDVRGLILNHLPDVLKADIEGAERCIFNVSNGTFKMVKEYIIETHSDELFELMKEKCKKCNYDIVNVNEWKPTIRIVYAKRRGENEKQG